MRYRFNLIVGPLFSFIACISAHAQDGIPIVAVKPSLVESAVPLRFSGTVTPERFSVLSPHVAGLVSSADIDEGYFVNRGEILVVLDATLAKLQLLESRARLDEAEARFLDAQRLRIEAEQLGQNISQSTLKSRIAQERVERAVIARLQVELDFQEEVVARHIVRAPYDGVVVEKLTEVGQWAEVSSPLIEFISTDSLRFDIQVPQDYYPLITREASAIVRISAFVDVLYNGTVTAVVPASDPDVRTFLVRLKIDNPSHDIIAGMSGEAEFGISSGKIVVEVPRDALVRYPDGSTSVWVVKENIEGQFAHERQVTLGNSFGEKAKITEGLDGTTLVVVRGNESLDNGVKVKLVERLPERNGSSEVTE